MDKTPLKKVIEIVGGQSALARILGVRPQAVQQWIMRDKIPPDRVLPIEAAVDGEVPCTDLAPKLYPFRRFGKCSFQRGAKP